FFQDYGMLAGMALVISLTDLHIQNIIVHAGRPHLIDLEDAFKHPMTTVGETGITPSMDRIDDPVGKELKIENEGTSELKLNHVTRAEERPSTSVLYRAAAGNKPARAATLDDPQNRRAVLEGLIAVVGTLAD